MSFLVRTKFDGHAPDGRRLYCKGGGGGGGSYYGNLNKLYSEQAASARLLRGLAEENLPGATDSYMRSVNEITDPGYADKQADMASADMASANAMERAAVERNLASMGVNPNDPRFAGSMRSAEVSNAARMAAGKNLARNDAKKFQLAVAQDAVGTFTGQSNSAASQMGGASSGLASLASQQNAAKQQEQAQQSANVSNTVGGAMAAWSMFNEGGEVRGHGLRHASVPGKFRGIERHMLGGAAGAQQNTERGFFQMQQVTPPPATPAQPQPQGANLGQLMRAGRTAKEGSTGSFGDKMAAKGAAHTDKIGRLVGKFSESAGNQIQSHAAGMRMAGTPDQASAAADAYRAAAAETKDAALSEAYNTSAANIEAGAGVQAPAPVSEATATPVGDAAASTATDVAGQQAGEVAAEKVGEIAAEKAGEAVTGAVTEAAATSTATSAAGSAASTGLGAAMGAIGTAMPWIGAAYAVGSLLGAWKDGGDVDQPTAEFSRAFNDDSAAQDLRDGAAVAGPGNHTDDVVPALLSNGEGVLNGEAMEIEKDGQTGREIMEELNKEGLKLREQGVTPDQIRRGYGLRGIKKEAA